MEYGEYCKLASCSTLTFLPVNCPYCRDIFCQSHFLPLQHECKAPGAAEADRTLSETEILKRVQRANERRKQIQQGVNADEVKDFQQEGPSKLPCQRSGCKNYSLELDQSINLDAEKAIQLSQRDGSHQNAKVTHAAPRCDRCRGFFCMKHRSAANHDCTAPAPPTIGDKRRDAANDRKQKAQEILNKHFPNRLKK